VPLSPQRSRRVTPRPQCCSVSHRAAGSPTARARLTSRASAASGSSVTTPSQLKERVATRCGASLTADAQMSRPAAHEKTTLSESLGK
jgi:hypothetical protein